ncbi:uncharacterized protein LOC106664621 isoform X1 [Cimex lectularius]|uniref:Uncharacterized protein n=2 Tax=Cimex lectularius TaxID=79782 RepID=A0A8I6RIC6_CIMLE|nr:uncharacterized protein LOC106664621 isoform X1 [Cimex lectularius]
MWIVREPARMVGGERTRAYRYGMTLLCVGALFNWLGLSDSEHTSDPVRFIGYTCLASGALLVFMAICFWANASQRNPHNQIRPEENEGIDVVVNMEPHGRHHNNREKPPEYDAVADLPPSYDDAIKLSPAYLQAPGQSTDRLSDVAVPTLGAASKPSDNVLVKSVDSSPLSRVIRLSSRFLRRTLSNVDNRGDEELPRTSTMHRSNSANDMKST